MSSKTSKIKLIIRRDETRTKAEIEVPNFGLLTVILPARRNFAPKKSVVIELVGSGYKTTTRYAG